MRTGAIFARGSCRALKWMALVGVVFVLGAGQAAAQTRGETQTLKIASVSIAGSTARSVTVQEQTTVNVVVTLNEAVADGVNDGSTTASSVDVSLESDISTTVAKGKAEPDDATTGGSTPVPASGSPEAGFRTISEGRKTVSFELELEHDPDAVDEEFTLTFLLNNVQASGDEAVAGQTAITATDITVMKTIKIDDDEEQVYEFDVTTADANIKEGSGTIAAVDFEANPPRPDMEPVSINVFVEGDDGDRYTVEPSASLKFDTTDLMHKVTVKLKSEFDGNDGDREDDEITLLAYSSDVNPRTAETVATEDITVKDLHALPAADKITWKIFDMASKGEEVDDAMIMEGGAAVYIEVEVDRGDGSPMGEKLDITFMPADPGMSADYRLGATSVDVPTGTKTQKAPRVKLEAIKDEDVGPETLVLNLVVTGDDDDNGTGSVMAAMPVMIDIVDATEKKVWVKDDAYDAIMEALGEGPLNPSAGGVSIPTSDMFGHTEDVTVSYGASVEGSAASTSASGDAVMVTPEMPGEAKITVTATASPAGSSFIPTQTSSDVAQITFPVMVELVDLMITLSMDEDMMNITEGMGAMVTATANRPVVGDTMVELIQTDGTASPSDYMAEPLMIMDGETMGTTMVMAVEDEMMEEGETLTLEGRVGEMKTNTVMFYIWDAAVPALPLIAQLLLAAFLAIGGYRRYLRR